MATAIDVQREILIAALAESRSRLDADGIFKSACELNKLFPDLVPERSEATENIDDFYRLLELDYDSPKSAARESYFRKAKKFLRRGNVKERREEYYALLNASLVLSNCRLRLSHDLVVSRQWLIENGAIPDQGALTSEMITFAPPSATDRVPVVIELLWHAKLIGPPEVQALLNQMKAAPQESLEQLILSAGYLTETEMRSLRLAETLLLKDKKIGPDDWRDLFTDDDPPPSPPKSGPEDPSPVPRRPLPSAGGGEQTLPLPEPQETEQ